LGGKTRKDAARQLGVPEGTLAARLVRGRGMLAKRLTRQGLTLSGGTLAVLLVRNAASAQVPTSVVASTIQAATQFAAGPAAAAGVLPATAVALTEGVLKSMLLTKLKITTAVLLLSMTVAAGGVYQAFAVERATTRTEALPSSPLQDAARGKGAGKERDKELIQGAWVAASGEAGGEKVGQDKLKQVRITFAKEKIEIVGLMPDKGTGTFSVDPAKKPKAINIRISDEGDVAGIYEFAGNSLKLCLNTSGGARPTEFTGTGQQILLTLKR
jgi:uncharacterized protein (TIGR03067 family)